jgi:uncharacterized membrane protein
MTDNVTLPGTGSVVETRSQADGSERQVITLGSNESANIAAKLERLANPVWFDSTVGALRVQLQNSTTASIGTIQIAANQNIATVAAVTTLNQVAGVPANSMVLDAMQSSWANSLRGRIT